MHNIQLDKNRRSIVASVEGNINIDQAQAMLNEFKAAVKGINAKDYIVVIHPENISASLFVLPILQSFIQLVSQLNFKKIYLINTDSYASIIKQSLSRYGLTDKVSYSGSIKDALNGR